VRAGAPPLVSDAVDAGAHDVAIVSDR
jgi:hypothetical protein